MILDQFAVVVDSYKTQRKNFEKELKRLEKLKASAAMHSTGDIIKRLNVNESAR